jgi:tRNA-dihydrouridine synthase
MSALQRFSVHPRTAKQAFTGKFDWNVIRLVKEAVEIPSSAAAMSETAPTPNA